MFRLAIKTTSNRSKELGGGLCLSAELAALSGVG
jgi:hypothetical protein